MSQGAGNNTTNSSSTQSTTTTQTATTQSTNQLRRWAQAIRRAIFRQDDEGAVRLIQPRAKALLDDSGPSAILLHPRNTRVAKLPITIRWTEAAESRGSEEDPIVEYQLCILHPTNGLIQQSLPVDDVQRQSHPQSAGYLVCESIISASYADQLEAGETYRVYMAVRRQSDAPTCYQCYPDETNNQFTILSEGLQSDFTQRQAQIDATWPEPFINQLFSARLCSDCELWGDAIATYEQILNQHKSTDTSILLWGVDLTAQIHVTLGSLYQKIGLKTLAHDTYLQALATITVRAEQPDVYAQVLLNMGYQYYVDLDYEKALENFQAMMPIVTTSDFVNSLLHGMAELGLGLVYANGSNTKNDPQAETHLVAAIPILAKSGSKVALTLAEKELKWVRKRLHN
ncbi:MAG: hypothetical protein AAF639_30275 [Chloroflexota bacterium]